MSWDLFLSLGDAYACGELLGARGFGAAWAFLFSAETTAWMRGCASPDELDKIARQWGAVWWRYLCACAGVCPAALSEDDAACVVHLGCEALRTSARARSVFLAVMFQLVVTERHDQMLCSIRGNPLAPPFYSEYVSRSKIGSTFSLRSLLRCENRYVCAKRTVDRFRGVKGRVVAEIYAPGGAELIRLGRTKLKRFMCARCASKRPRPGCKKCTRLQERNPKGIVSYFGQHRAYTLAKDVQTVCGDAIFVAAEQLQPGDIVLHHTNTASRRVRVATVARAAGKVIVEVRDVETGHTTKWERVVKSVVPVLRCRPDTVRMMLENPDVVHGMGMSVHPDKISEHWFCPTGSTGSTLPHYPVATTSPIHLSSLKNEHAQEYALWRSLATMVRHLLPKEAPKHVYEALCAADTHCLHHYNHSFQKR